MKTCNRCNEDLPLSEFHNNSSRSDGKADACKPCNNKYKNDWRKANPEKNKIQKHANRSPKSKAKSNSKKRLDKYGLSPCEFTAMRIASGDKCEICSSDFRLAIDHDHTTGAVRGMLCYHCNIGIGMLRDDVERLESAIRYLKK